MTDHETDGCRYTIGELKSEEPWRYCGAERKPGSSYCPGHHAACYYRLRRRNRVEDNPGAATNLTHIVGDAA